MKKKDSISIVHKEALILGIGMVLCSLILVMPVVAADEGTIAFCSFRDGNSEMYVMNVNGSNQTRLTNDPATEQEPSWSPDGSKIAFSSSRHGIAEIYVMNANGSNQIRLTNNGATDANPAWSPDGSKIAFDSSSAGTDDYEICVINADGTGQIRLTNNTVHD